MLEKSRRLDKKKFNEVYQSGKNVSSEIGYFKIASRGGKTKMACVATKKDSGRSVDRSRIRRRGYAALEEFSDRIPDGYGIIWFLPSTTLTVEFSQLTQAVEKMIQYINE